MNMPRNVLYVSHTADLRGSAMSLRELMLNLDADRFAAHALLSKHGPLEEILANAGIPHAVLAQRGFLNLGRIAHARGYIRQHRIDLVHLNSAVPFCRDVGVAARTLGVPIVWHIREDPQGKRVRRWSKWIRLLADRIVVVSSDLEDRFRSSGRAVKIYNGIDLDRFSPHGDDGGWRERLGIEAGTFVFIIVGTIEERKGQHLAIEAAARLIDQAHAFHLVIVGSALGPEDAARLDNALAHYPQVASITHCVGRQADVAPLLRAADCLMLPSAWEGFPRTVAEAMACGLPAIATSVGEIPQMIGAAEGWLVPARDVVALENAMKEALESAGRADIRERVLRKARNWSRRRHVEQIQSLYETVLEKQSETRGRQA